MIESGRVPSISGCRGRYDSLRLAVVTVGGAGLLPGAPGTWGSFATCAVLYGMYIGIMLLPVSTHYLVWSMVLAVGVLLSSVVTVALGPWACSYFQNEDPPSFVLDETAGICLTLFLLPVHAGWWTVATFALAFVTFRIFDVLKPPPARQLERLPKGWGILLDDLAAAVFANVLCQIVLRWWLLP